MERSSRTPRTPDEVFSHFLAHCKRTTLREVVVRSTIVLAAWVCMSLMLFGMNFMLDSFVDSRAASYTTLITSALIFLGGSAVLCLAIFVATCTTDAFAPGRAAFSSSALFDKSHLKQLAVLGLVDCLGGFTGTYGAPNTPIAVQFTIVASSIVWTFLLTRCLVTDRHRPCTLFVFSSVMLTVLGAVVTVFPQWHTMTDLHGGVASSIGWIVVYFFASLFPLMLNVLYSRYLVDWVDHQGRSVIPDSGDDDDDDDDDADVVTASNVDAGDQQNVIGADVVVTTAAAASSSSNTHIINSRPAAAAASRSPLIITTAAPACEEVALINARRSRSSSSGTSSTGSTTPAASAPAITTTARQTGRGISSNWPYFAARLSIAVLGDAVFQIVFIVALMPLDAVPWFGASANMTQTTDRLRQGFADVFAAGHNPHTPVYFVLYFLGFFTSHFIGATLSYYSPQLTAFIYSVNTPVNLILLVIFPAWNVFGLVAPVWASALSIGMTAVGALMYAGWEQLQRHHHRMSGSRAAE